MRRDVQYFQSMGSTIQVTVFKCGDVAAKNLGLTKNSPEPIRIKGPNAVRNEWLYDQYVSHPEKTNESIRREARLHGWSIETDSHFLQCIDRHCTDNGIDKTRRKPKTA